MGIYLASPIVFFFFLPKQRVLSHDTHISMIAAAGMCLGGHLALRCCVTEAPRVKAGMCWFATDLQYSSSSSATRGSLSKSGDDTLQRVGECQAEVIMVGFDESPGGTDKSD